MTNDNAKITITLVAGLCIGGGTGYLIAKHRLRAETEREIEGVKALYRRLRDQDAAQARADWNPPSNDDLDDENVTAESLKAEAVKLGYTTWENADKPKVDLNYIPPEPQMELDYTEEEVDDMRRIRDAEPHPEDDRDPRTWERDPEFPYVITDEEYRLDFPEHEKLSITYYKGDDTLSDERDQFIPDPDGTVLKSNLQYFGLASGDDRLLHIRNERVGADFEVALNDGAYSREVLGFDIEEDMVRESKDRIKKMRHRE